MQPDTQLVVETRADVQPRRAASNRRVPAWAEQREAGLVVVLALVTLAFTLQERSFLSVSNVQDIALDASTLMIVAAGQTLVVISRNIDLSVGAVLGLSGFVAADLLQQHGLEVELVFAVGIGAGLLLGAVNGGLVTVARVPAIVATLGTLYAYRGVDFLLGGEGRQVNADDLPDSFIDIANAKVVGVPVLFIVALAVVALLSWCMRHTRWGRNLYAIGSNPDAARPAGIPAGRTQFIAFCICGMLAGLAGVMWASRFAGIDPQAGTGFELTVIAAVVVGGVNIFGGMGTVWGAALGAVLLTVGQIGLTVVHVSPFWLDAIYGAAIVLAVLLNAEIHRRLERPHTARAGR